MAKYIKEFENGTSKETLIFRDKEFVMTKTPWENGVRHSIEKCFEDQVKEAFPDEDEYDLEDILDAVDKLDYGSDDDIEEALEELEQFE
jgi:hypothetical protein